MPSTLTLVGSPTIGSIDNAADLFWIWDTSTSSLNKVTVSTIFNNFSNVLVYANGISGGQSLSGGTAANDDLTLQGTTNATRTTSYVLLQPNGGNVGISTTSPSNFNGVNLGGSIFDVNHVIQVRGDTTNNIAIFQFGGDTYRKATIYSSVGTDTPYLAFAVSNSGSTSSVTERMRILSNGEVGIGVTAPTAMLQVEQTSATGAKPTLRLRQADLTEEFIRFETTTIGTGNPINTTALGTYYGRVRVFVEGIGEKWLALYN